jgi:hypothetical protein
MDSYSPEDVGWSTGSRGRHVESEHASCVPLVAWQFAVENDNVGVTWRMEDAPGLNNLSSFVADTVRMAMVAETPYVVRRVWADGGEKNCNRWGCWRHPLEDMI